jgi:hypothetical protein
MVVWIILIIALILYFLYFRSNFGNIVPEDTDDDLLNKYQCSQEDPVITNRPYPSGNVPGSYLTLTGAEKKKLLTKFINYKGE